jgi:hypothetical protein
VENPRSLEFSNGNRAVAVQIGAPSEIGEALRSLGLSNRPVLVLVGGASNATGEELASIGELVEPLVATASRVGAAILDGGTNAGAMQAAGEARARLTAELPLVGVVPAGLAHQHELEPHHTHFVLVPGSEFGSESPWMARLAGCIAGDRPSVTVLIGGGDVSWIDLGESVAAGRRILALVGSDRAADELALGRSDRARTLLASGLVELLDLREDRVSTRVEECLRGQ